MYVLFVFLDAESDDDVAVLVAPIVSVVCAYLIFATVLGVLAAYLHVRNISKYIHNYISTYVRCAYVCM